jgi:hypothetical protein
MAGEYPDLPHFGYGLQLNPSDILSFLPEHLQPPMLREQLNKMRAETAETRARPAYTQAMTKSILDMLSPQMQHMGAETEHTRAMTDELVGMLKDKIAQMQAQTAGTQAQTGKTQAETGQIAPNAMQERALQQAQQQHLQELTSWLPLESLSSSFGKTASGVQAMAQPELERARTHVEALRGVTPYLPPNNPKMPLNPAYTGLQDVVTRDAGVQPRGNAATTMPSGATPADIQAFAAAQGAGPNANQPRQQEPATLGSTLGMAVDSGALPALWNGLQDWLRRPKAQAGSGGAPGVPPSQGMTPGATVTNVPGASPVARPGAPGNSGATNAPPQAMDAIMQWLRTPNAWGGNPAALERQKKRQGSPVLSTNQTEAGMR